MQVQYTDLNAYNMQLRNEVSCCCMNTKATIPYDLLGMGRTSVFPKGTVFPKGFQCVSVNIGDNIFSVCIFLLVGKKRKHFLFQEACGAGVRRIAFWRLHVGL